ncbi:MAG TPA: OsmC family protein [Thermomicrobiales bacterium]|nr:OsmC family protein [Thermomicrobiales bacterium]
MSGKAHTYPVTVTWTGNTGEGTTTYRAYRRDHEISVDGKPVIPASSDPAFRGDPARYNPEELFVASLSQCHMLWYLHLCADNGVNVVAYVDRAEGVMAEDASGSGRFTRVTLRPGITLAPGSDAALADTLHHAAHEMCFIARSVSVPVAVEATYLVEDPALTPS